ncbi:MAG: tRNA uridine-5-carboxymethylaminomethyl(34) synthesis GTPase MnmE, partial [Bacteroidota bacterium]
MESPLTRSELTIAAIATPPGVGAIAVIRLSGKDAISIGDKVFKSLNGSSLAGMASHKAVFGTIVDQGEVVD